MRKKVVLAFSGGLDTSFCTAYLDKEEDMDVHTVIVNTGGFTNAELEEIEQKARYYGAKSHISLDVREDYYSKCIRYLIFGNVLRNRNYPLSVSSERSFQALKVLDYARKINADAIAHGSTGAGNDQVRFESMARIMNAEMEVLAPVRELGISRENEISWLSEHNLVYEDKSSKYSINQGLWGTSVGGAETLDSATELPESAFPGQVEESESRKIELEFKMGEPVALENKTYTSKIDLIQSLDDLASAYGIGRDIHVGETIIGIKGRVGFQAAAAKMLIDAHYALEKHVLTKWQQHWKEQLGNWYGMFVHEAMFLEPSMRDIEAFLESSQRNVSGKVFLRLRPYSFSVTGVDSPNDLMRSDFANYGEENRSWNDRDMEGFVKVFSNASKIYYSVNPHELNN